MEFPTIHVEGKNLTEAYHRSLVALLEEGEIAPCPEWNTKCLEVYAQIRIRNPMEEPMISGLSICEPYSLEKYRMEMLYGILDWSVDAGLEPYTYHLRMGEQVDRAIKELKRSGDSRRAAITIRMPGDYELEDAPCLQHIQFLAREGKLYAFVLFRSNDAVKAAFMNMFALVLLQKEVADELGLEVGDMFYNANSYHCYERDFRTLKKYVWAIEEKTAKTYSYIGEWDEMMEEERGRILNDVRGQKEKRVE